MLATQSLPASRHSLLDQIQNARQRTDDLFSLVKSDALYDRPIPERHRIIFYIGHLEAFDWNLLSARVLGLKSFHPEYDRLFAFGIDPVGGGLPTDQPTDWPSVSRVREYVRNIRSSLDDRLEADLFDSTLPQSDGFPLETLLTVAIEHRLMHAETLAYMLHQLPLDRKVSQSDPPVATNTPVIASSVEIPAGRVTLGLSRSSGIFGWDNEYESHDVEVSAFNIDRYKTTNGEYLNFIADGGYENRAFWTDSGDADDWNWKSQHDISHPAFWRRDGDRWLYRTMFEDIPLPLDWPVYVSLAEARAFAKWAGKSLPTEAEWQRAAFGGATSDPSVQTERNEGKFGNFNFVRWNPVPVNLPRDNGFGVCGMLGNGWEWTSTPFGPFTGFTPFPFYRGYSADFFDGKHFVMKGGSARTAACMLRPTFRNWFQAHYQFIYTGFRCVTRGA